MKDLANKVAIVTGAASGIGKETALLFAANGVKVVVSDINEEDGQKVVEEIKNAGGEALFIKCDTSKPEEHEAMVQETIEKYGALHIAVNNAGVGGPSAPMGEYDIKAWQKVIDINLNGVFYGMRYQLPAMVKSGNGSIINISSILGHVGFANSSAYVASKHAVVGMTKSAGWEYATKNVRVNAIGPGFIYTGLVNEETMGKEGIQILEQKHAPHRLGEGKEVAELCLFLASDKASFITASYYPVDGGYLAV